MLAGGSGVDTLAVKAGIAATGCDASIGGLDIPALGRGRAADIHRVLSASVPSQDLRIALILYRIEAFSFLAPERVGLRMGYAR